MVLQLEQQQEYRNFADSIKSPATLLTYNYSLKYYMSFRKTTNVSSLLQGDIKMLEAQLIEFIVSMRQNKLSYGIINTRLAAIKKFYVMNDIVMNWEKISQYLGESTRLRKDRAYTNQEISTMLLKADERMRVVILLLAS